MSTLSLLRTNKSEGTQDFNHSQGSGDEGGAEGGVG